MFLGALVLLIITFVFNGVGVRGAVNASYTDSAGASIVDANRDQQETRNALADENSALGRIIKSYLFWIAIGALAASYGLTFI